MSTEGPRDPEFDAAAFDAAFEKAFGAPAEADRPATADVPVTGDVPVGSEGRGEGDEATSGDMPDGGGAVGGDVPGGGGAVGGAVPDGGGAVGGAVAGGGGSRQAPAVRRRSVVAVVVTPINSAPALAGLCAIAKIDADIVPTRHGALAVRVIGRTDEVDADELLTGAPAEANQLARALSRTTKLGVVLLTSHLGEGDEGLTGTITGRRFENGEPGEEVPAGLILAGADDIVERLLLGTVAPGDAPGRLEPRTLTRWQAGRLFTRAVRRRRP